ncbi:chaplin [Streptomyces sp. NBC_00344]|uniref:chaplin n=1 Tax=Streptomyces sp. NBC_00344 TaxID=2975720 RepID=UPI002E214415
MSRIAKAAAVLAGTGAVLAGSAGLAMADSGAQGAAIGSPGVASGNVVQVPIHIPVNVCGNTVNVIGLLNPAAGNTCINADDHGHKRHDGNDDSRNGGHKKSHDDSRNGAYGS